MNIYYIENSNTLKYNMGTLIKGDKSISQLKNNISSIRDFCRDEESIETKDLTGYLNAGITLYTLDNNNLSGVLNFDINGNNIYIYGLCVPGKSGGVGSAIITSVKEFAKTNNVSYIKLECYGDIFNFYTKNGFRTLSETPIIDEDEEEPTKTKYEMIFNVSVIGGKKRKTKRNLKKRGSKKQKSGTRKLRKTNSSNKKYYKEKTRKYFSK
jgi:hypothetical protein